MDTHSYSIAGQKNEIGKGNDMTRHIGLLKDLNKVGKAQEFQRTVADTSAAQDTDDGVGPARAEKARILKREEARQ